MLSCFCEQKQRGGGRHAVRRREREKAALYRRRERRHGGIQPVLRRTREQRAHRRVPCGSGGAFGEGGVRRRRSRPHPARRERAGHLHRADPARHHPLGDGRGAHHPRRGPCGRHRLRRKALFPRRSGGAHRPPPYAAAGGGLYGRRAQAEHRGQDGILQRQARCAHLQRIQHPLFSHPPSRRLFRRFRDLHQRVGSAQPADDDRPLSHLQPAQEAERADAEEHHRDGIRKGLCLLPQEDET